MAGPMIAGVDEAGRGPVLGPLVVACAITDDEAWLRQVGVRDSKALSPSARRRIQEELESKLRGRCVLAVNAAKIDSLMEDNTLNEIEVTLFAKAVLAAARSVGMASVDVLQVDAADVNAEQFGKHVQLSIAADDPEFQVHIVVSRHKADSQFPAVGAASILAKVERDRLIKNIGDEIGSDVGSGYPSDPTTIQFLREYISANGDVPPFCRRSWQTTTDLLNEAGLLNKRLEDY